MVQLKLAKDQIQNVNLNKTGSKSFGICIVRGEVKDSPDSKTTGIFIKGIVPQSPAQLCGKLKVGDRILSLNENDVRNVSEQAVIDLIKDAGMEINIQIQTFSHVTKIEAKENGYVKRQTKHGQDNQVIEKTPNSNDLIINSGGELSIRNKTSSRNDEDDEDTRDMTGLIRTEAGFEIDRASAGNCKLTKEEKEKDKENEDEYGYTMVKVKKRYNVMKDVRKVEIQHTPNIALGIALAGHRDRQKMACFIAGIDPKSILSSNDILPGDEILEVNGKVLQNRCHLNASVVIKNIAEDKLVFITSRRKSIDEGISVKPIKRFSPIVDDTRFLFEQFPNARSVQIKKDGFLGIMIIFGKHIEVGNGIFISDLREDSNADLAGIKVGDMILAVNKDVTLESRYDEAVALIKRAEGIVSLVILTLKTEASIRLEKEAEEKRNDEAKAEVEKPQDPSIAEIKTNKKMLIEIKIEKRPLGAIVVGGKNNYVKSGCVITHLYPDGALAIDNRVKVLDHILEVNSVPINCSEMTTLKVHQTFHMTYDKTLTLLVYRAEPCEVENFTIEFIKKNNKELGLSLAPNSLGCVISEITTAGYADIDNKLQRGDIISKFNGESLANASFAECFSLFKSANGKIYIEITRPKPICRTGAPKT